MRTVRRAETGTGPARREWRTRRRMTAAVSLLLAAVTACAALTYAWFINYVDVAGTRVQTGKMLYEFHGLHYNGDTLVKDFSYSTENSNNGSTLNYSIDLLADEGVAGEEDEGDVTVNPSSINPVSALAHLTVVDAETVGQSFFVVSKLEGSIDFDVGIAFSFDGLAAEYTDENGETVLAAATDYANSMWFKVIDESAPWRSYVQSVAEPTVEGYAATHTASGDMLDPTDSLPLSQLAVSDKEDYSNFKELSGDEDQMLIRVIYGWNSDFYSNAQAVDLPVKIHLSVAQVDGLTGGVEITESVYTYEQLRGALSSYKAGSAISIAGDITYPMDLTITRPVTLIIQGSLTVQGNLTFVYADGGGSEIRTRGGGQLIVQSNNGLGGNFVTDLPSESLKLTGSNIETAGKADIYVSKEFRVRTAVTTVDPEDNSSGLCILGSRICRLDASGDPMASNTLQPIILTGAARLYVDKRTNIGTVTASNTCDRFQMVNMGSVEMLDLRMMLQDTSLKKVPAIDIDSRGYWGNDEDHMIRLPGWSIKFNDADTSGNTRIESNPGSGPLKAFASVYIQDETREPGTPFYSDYDTDRMDIVPHYRDIFVETVSEEVDGEIISVYRVHYDSIHDSMRSVLGLSEDDPFGTTLESIVSYYYGDIVPEDQRISEVTAITALEIICYGTKELTVDDYAYIRTMGALKYLNIQDTVSTDKTLPAGALKNLKNLRNVVMSDSDTTWMPNAFSGTDIQEIWLPASLQTLANSTDAQTKSGVTYQCSKNDVIGNIRVVHTSTTVVTGFSEHFSTINGTTYQYTNYGDAYYYDNDNNDSIYKIKQYFFTPDEITLEAYRAKFPNENNATNTIWNRCVFLDGEMYPDYNGDELRGFYVLRLNDNEGTCEFVTYTGDEAFNAQTARDGSFAFNFETITVNGKQYRIVSYDDYAFANRIKTSDLDITFGDSVVSVGDYAFASLRNPDKPSNFYTKLQKFSTITFKGQTEIGYQAFRSVSNLTEVSGDFVKVIAGYAFESCANLEKVWFPLLSEVTGSSVFYNCSALSRVDIGVIERTDANATEFLPANYGMNIEIHTTGAGSPDSYTAALCTTYGRTFVASEYAHLYTSNYVATVADMGPSNTPETLLRADADGNILPQDSGEEPAYYFYVREVDGVKSAVLVACLLDTIDGEGGDYTTIGAFRDSETGEEILVTRIGGAAYRLTKITGIDTLTVADSVTEIGPGAFYSAGFAKNCITFDLNNTVLAEAYAFYGMGPIRLVGNELETIGIYTLSSLSKMIVACLPKLDEMIGVESQFDNKNKSAFVGCTELRVVYVGPSRNVRYLQSENNTANTYTSIQSNNKILKMFFINGAGVTENVTRTSFSHMSIVVGNCENNTMYYKTGGDSANGVRINAGANFENIVLSNWYTLTGENGGVSYEVTLPGYLYTKNSTEGTLTLRATAYHLTDAYGDTAEMYVTPDALYVDDEPVVYGYDEKGQPVEMIRYVARELAGQPVYRVTGIGQTAYNSVLLNTKYLRIGSSTTSLSTQACYTYSTVSNVQTLDLNNVTSVGQQALNIFGSTVTTVIADRVTSLGQYAFSNLSSVKKLFLPAIRTIGQYAFSGMKALDELILGKNFESFSNNPMISVDAPSLKIIILNDQAVVESPAKHNDSNSKPFGSSKAADNNSVFVVVPQKQYESYRSRYETTGWTRSSNAPKIKVPFSNFSVFEASYEDTTQNLTFFWSKVGEDGATITFVVGNQIPETLVFPDTVVDDEGKSWTVVSVENSAVEMLSTVKHIVLPAGMRYLGFTSTALPANVQSLTISQENTKFKTEDGVLYSADGSILLLFPRGNVPEDSEFEVPASVTHIADEAFYGVANILTLRIQTPVRFGYRAFAGTKNLVEIYFASSVPSEFVGREIFANAESALVLYVPADSVEAYRNNVWLNYEIRDMILPVPEPDPKPEPEEGGEENGDGTVTG